MDPQLAVQHEKEKKAEAENAALLAGRPLGYKEATPEPEEDLSHVTVFGPVGITTEFDLKTNWGWVEESGSGADITGETPDGKPLTTAGLGGSLFAIIEEK